MGKHQKPKTCSKRRILLRIGMVACILFGLPLICELAARLVLPDATRLFVLKENRGVPEILPNLDNDVLELTVYRLMCRQRIRLAPGLTHIVGVGESTLAGFAFGTNASNRGSFLRIAEAVLKAKYPQQLANVRVHNYAVPGRGLRVMAKFVEELTDLGLRNAVFIVQCGHNEGLFHEVARTLMEEHAAYRFTTWLRERSRLFDHALRWAASNDNERKRPEIKYLTGRMRALMRRHAKDCLSRITEAARRSGSTVILCTSAANERDCPPEVYSFSDKYKKEDFDMFLDVRRTAARNYILGRWREAAANFQECIRMTGGETATFFWLARVKERFGNDHEAVRLYRMARNLDGTTGRARGSDAMNALIRSHATEAGHLLFDMDQIARAKAGDRPVGKEEMLDNVHPNYGMAFEFGVRLAEALTRALKLEPQRPLVLPGFADSYMKFRNLDIPSSRLCGVSYYLEVNLPDAAEYYADVLGDREGDLTVETFAALLEFEKGNLWGTLARLQKILKRYDANAREQFIRDCNSIARVVRHIKHYPELSENAGLGALPVGMLVSRRVSERGGLQHDSEAYARLEVTGPEDCDIYLEGRKVGRGSWAGRVRRGYHFIAVTTGKAFTFRLVRVFGPSARLNLEPEINLPEGLNAVFQPPLVVLPDGTRMRLFRHGMNYMLVDEKPVTRDRLLRACPQAHFKEKLGAVITDFPTAQACLAKTGKRLIRYAEWFAMVPWWKPAVASPGMNADPHRDVFVGAANALQEFLLAKVLPGSGSFFRVSRDDLLRSMMPGEPWDEYMLFERGGNKLPCYTHYRLGRLRRGPFLPYDEKRNYMVRGQKQVFAGL